MDKEVYEKYLKREKAIAKQVAENEPYEKPIRDFFTEKLGTPYPLFFVYKVTYQLGRKEYIRYGPEIEKENKIMLLDKIYELGLFYDSLKIEDGRLVKPRKEIKGLFPNVTKALLWQHDLKDRIGHSVSPKEKLYALNINAMDAHLHSTWYKLDGFYVFNYGAYCRSEEFDMKDPFTGRKDPYVYFG